LSLSLPKKRKVEVTRIFEENHASRSDIVINRGGARSSKSFSIGQLFTQRFSAEKNKNFLIVRKTFPALRLTAYKLMLDLMADYNLLPFYFHNKSNHEIACPHTGNWMVFTSIDDPEKIKSTEWNYIWTEEATELTKEDVKILELRLSAPNDKPNQLFMSFNPIDAFHWIKTDLIDKDSDVHEIKSSYLDNPFLSEQYVKRLLKLKEQDPNYWQIYGEGEWGILEGLIFHRWEMAKDWPEPFDETIYGLDFGWNHPTALVEINFTDGLIYERELIYEGELTTQALLERMDEVIPRGLDGEIPPNYIFCENEPDRIEEISQYGYNAWPADKGPGSVRDGIDYLQTLTPRIHQDSINLIDEMRAYKWKADKNGHLLDEPVKFKDDLMDARRYAHYTYQKQFMAGADWKEDFGLGETESSKGSW
jgi:phage terminase large subunit